jgi:predicted secreted protein
MPPCPARLPVRLAGALLAFLVCLGTGCGPEEPTAPGAGEPTGPVEIRVGLDRDGGSTALRVGHVLRVELPSDPTSGTAWEIESVDESVLRVPFEEFVPPDDEGGSGTSIWRFEAVGAGLTTLRLGYVRFGEDVPTAQRTFSFRVVVD